MNRHQWAAGDAPTQAGLTEPVPRVQPPPWRGPRPVDVGDLYRPPRQRAPVDWDRVWANARGVVSVLILVAVLAGAVTLDARLWGLR